MAHPLSKSEETPDRSGALEKAVSCVTAGFIYFFALSRKQAEVSPSSARNKCKMRGPNQQQEGGDRLQTGECADGLEDFPNVPAY